MIETKRTFTKGLNPSPEAVRHEKAAKAFKNAATLQRIANENRDKAMVAHQEAITIPGNSDATGDPSEVCRKAVNNVRADGTFTLEQTLMEAAAWHEWEASEHHSEAQSQSESDEELEFHGNLAKKAFDRYEELYKFRGTAKFEELKR